jgi:pimeloyl-ACP methyl ester carboxylesterase
MDLMPAGLGPAEIHGRRLRWSARRAGFRQAIEDTPHGRLAVWQGGYGRPLLLVSGFAVEALWQWDGQLGALGHRHRVVAPDLVGHGGSAGAIHSPLQTMVGRCASLMEQLGHEQYDVCGLSYGGFVALGLAREHAARVRRVVISDCPGPAFTWLDYEQLLERFGVASIEHLLLPAQASGMRNLVEIAWHRPPWLPDFVLSDVHERMFTLRRSEQLPLLAEVVEMVRNPPEIDCRQPTLVCWGEHDRVFPLETGRRLVERLPNARLEVFPSTAHTPNIQQPRRFNRVLQDFLG